MVFAEDLGSRAVAWKNTGRTHERCEKKEFYCRKSDYLLYQEGGVLHQWKKRARFNSDQFYTTLNLRVGRDYMSLPGSNDFRAR
jgi:hypothetical protein